MNNWDELSPKIQGFQKRKRPGIRVELQDILFLMPWNQFKMMALLFQCFDNVILLISKLIASRIHVTIILSSLWEGVINLLHSRTEKVGLVVLDRLAREKWVDHWVLLTQERFPGADTIADLPSLVLLVFSQPLYRRYSSIPDAIVVLPSLVL